MRHLPLVVLFAACAIPIDIAGGPDHSTHRIKRDNLGEGIRPLVAGEPAALSALDHLDTRETRSTIIIYSELAFLAPCIALPAIDKYEGNALFWTGIASCGVTVVLGIIGILDAPNGRDYADVLRIYNASHPDAPWSAPALDLK
jgi:hypothetical protein